MEGELLTWHERNDDGHKTGRTYVALKGEGSTRFIGYCDDKITKTILQYTLAAPNLPEYLKEIPVKDAKGKVVGKKLIPSPALGLVFFRQPLKYSTPFTREQRVYIATQRAYFAKALAEGDSSVRRLNGKRAHRSGAYFTYTGSKTSLPKDVDFAAIPDWVFNEDKERKTAKAPQEVFAGC